MDSAQAERGKGDLLVVDDDLTARQTMEAFLTREGYDMRLAPNGEMALMVAKEEPPEMILLDIRLPDIEGILQDGLFPSESVKIYHWLDFICEETCRIQDLGLTLLGEGKEEVVDLTERLKKRFLINKGALEELGRDKIRLVEEESGTPLTVRCFPLHLDRILDNLLSNATNAIPGEGGELSIQSYQKDTWGVAEIVNTGRISEEDKERLLLSDGRGRGLHITVRLVKYMGGRLEMETLEGLAIFRLFLPMAKM